MGESKFICPGNALISADFTEEFNNDMTFDQVSQIYEIYEEPDNSRALMKTQEMPPAIPDSKLLGGKAEFSL